jgi:predicted glycosyltransferase involved in capsule biosynthesis
MDKKMDKNLGTPCNIFVIKKEIFEAINGYDEKFDGRHGGEDTNFHDRFSQFIHKNNIDRGFRGEEKIFVYPDPAGFNKHMFHTSGRKDK